MRALAVAWQVPKKGRSHLHRVRLTDSLGGLTVSLAGLTLFLAGPSLPLLPHSLGLGWISSCGRVRKVCDDFTKSQNRIFGHSPLSVTFGNFRGVRHLLSETFLF